ncbi:MAG: J domain-containing protein [Chloroherpetonaceae bacterium]|nr:J domain-containing protein [Chloroherpetonaceae bacterium]
MSLFSRLSKILKAELRTRLHYLQDEEFRKFYIEYLKKKKSQGNYSGSFGSKRSETFFESEQEWFYDRYNRFYSSEGNPKTESGNYRQKSYSTPREPDKDPILAAYYANLELPYGSDSETVRKAWLNLVRKYHPDKFNGDPEKQKLATEITKGINTAYQELTRYLKGKK